MDGEQDAAQTKGQQQGGQAQQEAGQDAQAGQKQDQQEPQEGAVSGGGGTDYAAQLKAKDAEIEALGKEIADLKARLADERTEFALRSAGARSVTAAKALLAEHDGDVAALVAAEPWLFEGAGTKGGAEGTTGLEPAGASGGSDAQYMKRWAIIAGLDEKE